MPTPSSISRGVEVSKAWLENLRLRQAAEVAIKKDAAYTKLDELKKVRPMDREILKKEFTGKGTHYSYAPKEFGQFDTFKSSGDAWETSGVHIGTDKAASDRARDMLAAEYQSMLKTDVLKEMEKARGKSQAVVPINKELFGSDKGHVLDLRFREGKYPKGDLGIMTEDSARLWLEEQAYSPEFFQFLSSRWEDFKKAEKARLGETPDYAKGTIEALSEEQKKKVSLAAYKNYGQLLGQYLSEVKGYTHLPYVNAQEDMGSVSYIIFDPHKNLRRADAAFMSEYGGLKAGVTGAAGAAGVASQAVPDKSEAKTYSKPSAFVVKPRNPSGVNGGI